MADKNHSNERGLRVHYLTNLGGLIALAGLDVEPPDFLLGALLQVAQEARLLSLTERADIAAQGQVKLDQRATGKRAWTAWNRARGLYDITLSAEQIRRLIARLGGSPPESNEALAGALTRTLDEAK
jgi:hypothetical protein